MHIPTPLILNPRAVHRISLARSVIAGIVTTLVLWTATGCSKSDPATLLAQGRAALEQNEPAVALVHLKAYVLAVPQSAEGRLLLGRALLASGDAAGAVVELERSSAGGLAQQQFAVPLARAYLASGAPAKVLASFGATVLDDPLIDSDLQLELATAQLAVNDLNAARGTLTKALARNPDNARAQLMRTRFMAVAGDLDGALRDLDRLLAESPKSADARQLKGEILFLGQGNTQAATAEFEAVLSIDGKFLPAHKALLDIAMRSNDVPLLERRIGILASALPEHPETWFAQTQLALARNDLVTAKERSERLLLAAPNDPRVLFLAGVVQLRSNALVAAEANLAKAVQQAPAVADYRRVLATLLVQTGDSGRAIDTLAPLISRNPPDAQALQISGQAELQRGRVAEAEALFRRALDASPGGNQTAARSLAMAQIARGDSQQGLASLQRLAAASPEVETDLTLVATLLARGEVERALKAVAALEAKAPALPVAHALRGRILASQGKVDAAKASFEQALKLDASYYPGVIGLAEIDLAAGRAVAARDRLQDHLKTQPRNYAALLRLVQIRVSTGSPPEETKELLERAIAAAPGDSAPRLLLVDVLLARRDLVAARTVAQQAVAASADDADLQDALGRVLVEAGDLRQAVAAFGRAVSLNPVSARAHLRLGDAQVRVGDVSAGRSSLERARQLDPASNVALQALTSLALVEKRYSEALALAREEQRRQPRAPLGYILEADVFLNQRNFAESARAMKVAFDTQPSSALAVRLHALQIVSGRQAEAARFSGDWLRANPRDAEFISHLGALSLQRNDFAAAEGFYGRVVDIQPQDALALNNLAWALVQQKKPEALEHARKANQLVPNQPQMMNTLATALRAAGNVPEAIEWQRKSVAASNGEPRYRMQLAEMLVTSGDKAGAREQLQALEALGDNFPQRDRVQELLKTVR